jgi:hypothetical protein
MTSPARINRNRNGNGNGNGNGSGKPQGSLVLDLLRERRTTLGIEAISATLAQRKTLLQRGSLIGLILLGSVLGLWTLLLLQSALLRSQMGQLEQFEGQAAELQAQIAARKEKLEASDKEAVRTTLQHMKGKFQQEALKKLDTLF